VTETGSRVSFSMLVRPLNSRVKRVWDLQAISSYCGVAASERAASPLRRFGFFPVHLPIREEVEVKNP
jgi:hypothetical protein